MGHGGQRRVRVDLEERHRPPLHRMAATLAPSAEGKARPAETLEPADPAAAPREDCQSWDGPLSVPAAPSPTQLCRTERGRDRR